MAHGNHNKLLGKVNGVDGIKTGFVNASGFNLAASMVRGNNRIIAVVMGGETPKSRDQKMVKLLETTYSKFAKRRTFKGKDSFDSIDDIIHALGPKTSSPTTNIHQATYLTDTGKIKVLNGKYNSVDDILNVLAKEQATLPVKTKPNKTKGKPKKPTKKTKRPNKRLRKA